MKIVVLHEPLGGARSVAPVPHGHGEGLLFLEPEPVGLPACARVKSVAHAPEELFGRGNLVRLARHEHPETQELAPRPQRRVGVDFADSITRAGHPAHPVEIAQAAGPALDVGLEQIHRAAEAFVASRRLGLEALDQASQVLLAEQSFVRVRDQVAKERLVPREKAQVEELGRGRQIRLREAHGVGRADDLVPYRKRGVPKRIKERLRERAGFARAEETRIDDEHYVGVAPKGDGSPPEAPDRGEGDAARPRSNRLLRHPKARAEPLL